MIRDHEHRAARGHGSLDVDGGAEPAEQSERRRRGPEGRDLRIEPRERLPRRSLGRLARIDTRRRAIHGAPRAPAASTISATESAASSRATAASSCGRSGIVRRA